MLDGERFKFGKEVNDLQVRVVKDEEKEEEGRRYVFDFKQKVGYFRYCQQNEILLKKCQNFNFLMIIKFFLGRERCFGNLKYNLYFNFFIYFEID